MTRPTPKLHPGITVTALDMTDQGHGILDLGRAAAALADAWRIADSDPL